MAQREYVTPTLEHLGSISEITLQGGFSAVDVPIGTPIGNTISSVVS